MLDFVTLTEAAADHIKHMLTKTENAIAFRLSIKKTGCSGYAYVPAIVTEIIEGDIHCVSQGLSIFVDPACEELIKGVIVDYVMEAGPGLKQKRLVFINPNEKNRCGCGESFTIE